MTASMTTPELKQFWEQTCWSGEHATVLDLLCVFINFGKLQNLFHAHTRKCNQFFWWLTFSFVICNAITNRGSCTLQLHWYSQLLSQQRFPDWTPPTSPLFPCIHTKFAARCVEGGQPAAVRGQCCEESTDRGLGGQDPLFLRGNLPTKKINNFINVIITDSTSRAHTRHYSSSEFPFTLMAELKWDFTDAYTI